MLKKILFVSLVSFVFVFSNIEVCFAAVSAQFEQAEAYKNNGEIVQAEEMYKIIVADYPGTDDALKAQKELVILYILAKRDTDAGTALDKLTTDFAGYSEPNDVAQALLDIARRYEWSAKYEEAKSVFQQILDNHPKSWYVNRANLAVRRINISYLFASSEHDEVWAAVNELVADPDLSKHQDLASALYDIGKKYEWAQRYEEAKSYYLLITQHCPDSPYADKVQLDISMINIFPPIKSGENDAAQIQIALDNLITDFNDYPELPTAVFTVGEQYYYKAFEDPNKCLKVISEEYLGKAKALWESIIAQWPQSQSIGLTHAYYFSAVCYRKLGEYEKAIPYYQYVVANWPDYQYAWSAQHLIGQCYENLRNSGSLPESEANLLVEDAYRKVLENYHDCSLAPQACLKLANLSLDTQQPLEAVFYFELFLYLADPNDPRIEGVEAGLQELN